MPDSLFNKFNSIIVFDVETTGTDYRRDEIIEIAMLRVEKGLSDYDIVEEYSSLVKLASKRKLPATITELTGITEEQLLKEGVLKEKVCEKVTDILHTNNPLIVAYNAQFDLCFLYYFLNRFGKNDVLKNVKMLDVLTIYRDRIPYPHRLIDAVSMYSLDTNKTHRALDDVKVTFRLLCEMGKEFDDLEHYVNLFGYNPKYGVSGPKISSVKYLPQGYDRFKKLHEI